MSISASNEPFVTATEVARSLKVSVSLVRKLTSRAEAPMPAYRIPGGGRSVRYLLSDVQDWMTKNTAE